MPPSIVPYRPRIPAVKSDVTKSKLYKIEADTVATHPGQVPHFDDDIGILKETTREGRLF